MASHFQSSNIFRWNPCSCIFCRWSWNFYHWFFFTDLFTTRILIVSYLLCRFSSLDILLRILHNPIFCCKTNSRLPLCRWNCFCQSFYCEAFFCSTFWSQIASEQFFVIRISVVTISSSFCPSYSWMTGFLFHNFCYFSICQSFCSQILLRDFFLSSHFLMHVFMYFCRQTFCQQIKKNHRQFYHRNSWLWFLCNFKF